MTVTASDAAVLVVNAEFRALIAADGSAAIDGLTLRIMMTARTICAAPLHVPSPFRVGHYMVCLRTLRHLNTSFRS